MSDCTFDAGDLKFVDVTQLFEIRKKPFPCGLDPEGFTLGREGILYVSSEGNTSADPIIEDGPVSTFINGSLTAAEGALFQLPDPLDPCVATRGVRLR